MSGFFARRAPGTIGLTLFLNAGDPPFEVLEDLVLLLDAAGVDCLELAVPFPNSVSDGPVIQRSAMRALHRGANLGEVIAFVGRIRPLVKHMRIALLADWSHTVRPLGLEEFLGGAAGGGADALLVHGLPPRLRGAYYAAAGTMALPVVTTCYATSDMAVLEEAARHASAYLYLVSCYGRTGSAPPQGFQHLQPLIHTLHGFGEAPIAVGFGVKAKADLDSLREAGADAAIVGSAFVACIEQALVQGRDVISAAEVFLAGLSGFGTPLRPVHQKVPVTPTFQH